MRHCTFRQSLPLVAVLACTGPTFGQGPGPIVNVPGDFVTIQAAINTSTVWNSDWAACVKPAGVQKKLAIAHFVGDAEL